MAIQTEFETHRFVGEVCRLRGQSIVEYRLPGSEISSILSAQATAIPSDCGCADGEVRYGGKVVICIVYEDGDKRICRAERGAEFFHKAEGGLVTPACFAKAALSAENITWRREGSGLYISVIVDADLAVYGGKQMEYLAGGEGLFIQTQPQTVYKTVCISGETDGEDEFDADYVGDILTHTEKAVAHRVTAADGQMEIEGEIALHICVLKPDDGVCSYERLLPFRMQIPSDEAYGDCSASARICVRAAHLTAAVDEEKGKSKMLFTYALVADCFLCIHEDVSVVSDAFSASVETLLKYKKDGGRYLTNTIKCTERVSGLAALSPGVDGEYSLQAALLPRVEISCRKTEEGFEAEGAVLADLLLCNANGEHRTTALSLPFAFPLNIDGDFAEADGLVCGLHVRRQKSGETEAEATLKLVVRAYEDGEWSYIQEVTEGETYPEETAAFSVYIPKAGEDLWSLAKRLKCNPADIETNNPRLQFPLKGDERIFVYRQIK